MSRQFHVPIILPADPTVDLEAATKKYVDVGGLRVGCLLTHSAAINTATTLTVPWGTEAYDTHGFHATNSADVVIPSGLDGTYAINMSTDAGGTLNGPSNVQITLGSLTFPSYIPASNRYGSLCVTVYCTAGNIIRGLVYNGHSGTATFASRLSVARVSA